MTQFFFKSKVRKTLKRRNLIKTPVNRGYVLITLIISRGKNGEVCLTEHI